MIRYFTQIPVCHHKLHDKYMKKLSKKCPFMLINSVKYVLKDGLKKSNKVT